MDVYLAVLENLIFSDIVLTLLIGLVAVVYSILVVYALTVHFIILKTNLSKQYLKDSIETVKIEICIMVFLLIAKMTVYQTGMQLLMR